MFERFINLFKGHAQGQKSMQVMPVGQGRTITVDANGVYSAVYKAAE